MATRKASDEVAIGIGGRIKATRIAASRSREWLGNEVGVSSSAVGLWESGTTQPTFPNALKIAKALGVNDWWLAFGEGPEAAPALRLVTPVAHIGGVQPPTMDDLLKKIENLQRSLAETDLRVAALALRQPQVTGAPPKRATPRRSSKEDPS